MGQIGTCLRVGYEGVRSILQNFSSHLGLARVGSLQLGATCLSCGPTSIRLPA